MNCREHMTAAFYCLHRIHHKVWMMLYVQCNYVIYFIRSKLTILDLGKMFALNISRFI
jgi:hypothetical protein